MNKNDHRLALVAGKDVTLGFSKFCIQSIQKNTLQKATRLKIFDTGVEKRRRTRFFGC